MIVSVVIPFYHGNKYVKNLCEMCRAAFECAGIVEEAEIIFVNDSPDEEIDIVLTQNVSVIVNKENQGIHISKLNGLKVAKGQYIHFLDQDDMIDTKFYERHLEEIRSSDISICNAIMEHKDYKRELYRSRFALWMVRQPLAYVYIDNRVESLGQCLIRRDAIPYSWSQNALRNNGADDYLLLLMMMVENKKICTIKDALYTHKWTNENLSENIEAMNKSVVSVARIMQKQYQRNNLVKVLVNKAEYLEHSKIGLGQIPFAVISLLRKVSRKLRG